MKKLDKEHPKVEQLLRKAILATERTGYHLRDFEIIEGRIRKLRAIQEHTIGEYHDKVARTVDLVEEAYEALKTAKAACDRVKEECGPSGFFE